MSEKLLKVKNLQISFKKKKDIIPVVEGVDFSMQQGEIVGIVGESGCGKSVSALSLLKLNAPNTVYGEESQVLFQGKDIFKMKTKELQSVRGKDISVIFQDSLTGLDPVMTLGDIMSEAIRSHRKISKKQALEESIEMLGKVGIPDPQARIKEYAHQLSGGMRQRVMIGLAMLHQSKLLIADEPTTALDVTIQAHILQLIKSMRDENGMSVILITHDMGVVAEMTDRIYVMYSGRVVEQASTKDIFESPLHPYTKGLLASIPRLNQKDDEKLYTIPGTVPLPGSIKQGCRFCNRCSECTQKCREQEPPFFEFDQHKVKCWKYENTQEVYI